MKDSGIEWIGEIPKDWETRKLKYDVISNESVLSEQTDPYFSFLYVDIGSVENGKGIVSFKPMNFIDAPSRARRVVFPSDVIVSTVRTYLKATAQIPACNRPVIVSTGFSVLKPNKSGKMTSGFLKYLVQCQGFVNRIEAYSNGVAYPSITNTELINTPIPLPSISKQILITDYLDHKCSQIDSLVSNIEAQIAKLDEYRKALITQAVTKGLHPNAEMKDSGVEWIGEIPKGWELRKLKWIISDIRSGDCLTAEDLEEENNDGKFFPVYGGNGKRGFYSDYNQSSEAILIGRQGALSGNVHLVKGKYWATDHALVTHFTKDVSIEYSRYLMEAMNLNQYAYETAAQPGLSISKIANLMIPFPDLTQQRQIAKYLNENSREIEIILETMISKLKSLASYKKSLIFDYVTGKKEVPADFRKEHSHD